MPDPPTVPVPLLPSSRDFRGAKGDDETAPVVSVHLLPSLIAPGALIGATAVVLDVLRATSVMVHALDSGCREIIPCLEVDEARRAAGALGVGKVLLGGERHGLPIPGFDLGNSPDSYSPEVCRDKTLVMTTTNGTRAILACGEASRVLIASFANLAATCGFLRRLGGGVGQGNVAVVCAGTEGEISHEDTLLAGAIVADLIRNGQGDGIITLGNDSARIALSHWSQAEACDARGSNVGIDSGGGEGRSARPRDRPGA